MTGPEALADLEPHGDIVERHGVRYGALISADEVYRYQLTRIWDDDRQPMLWIMLNPSTADGATDDNTIRRCMSFARTWGQGGIVVRNLFALRATDPDMIAEVSDPVGPFGDYWTTLGLEDAAPDPAADPGTFADGDDPWRPLILCAWGGLGQRPPLARERARRIVARLHSHGHRLHVLGLTESRDPRHPLYMRATAQPTPWEPA